MSAQDLVRRGLACFNVEYRKIGERTWKGFRSTLEDVASGVQYAANAVPQVPIAVVGHSAGGHLALWSQLRPVDSDVRLAVACGGLLDLEEAQQQGLGGGAGAVARFLQPLRAPRG